VASVDPIHSGNCVVSEPPEMFLRSEVQVTEYALHKLIISELVSGSLR
jgi:hypothetical protein